MNTVSLKRFFNLVSEYVCRVFLVSSKGEPDNQAQASQRRFLLVGTDFGLTLLVLIVVAVLANVFISTDDKANAGNRHERVTAQLSEKMGAPSVMIEEALDNTNELYRCPLHPEVESSMPGYCPIGGETLLRADAMNIAEPGPKQAGAGAYLNYVAHVGRDVRRVIAIELLNEGWIEKLFAALAGSRVKQGDLLLEIYSPKLADLQATYLDALSRKDMVELSIANDRLQVIGQSMQQIEALKFQREANGLSYLHAPADGIISVVSVSEGQFVPRDSEVFRLLDLSSVWMMFELDAESEAIVAGQRAEAFEEGGSGRVFTGVVDDVVSLSEQKNMRLVRLRFDADAAVLRNSEFANVRVYRQLQVSSLPGVTE